MHQMFCVCFVYALTYMRTVDGENNLVFNMLAKVKLEKH